LTSVIGSLLYSAFFSAMIVHVTPFAILAVIVVIVVVIFGGGVLLYPRRGHKYANQCKPRMSHQMTNNLQSGKKTNTL